MSNEIEVCIEQYREMLPRFEQFMYIVRDYFRLEPPFNKSSTTVIHSLKYRLKDEDHLRDKLARKREQGRIITPETLFAEVTDLAGVRVLHLYQDQFEIIHKKILEKVESKDWVFAESPKAYTWDPEAKSYFEKLNISCYQKESYYTSIHYLVKPREDSPLTCEIQVRTLFEEVWGEIDHTINYPHQTESIACREQIRVLSKLVSTGTRLADSIFRSYQEHKTSQNKSPVTTR
ncbi:RelA/SpoT domain-containing protein [Paenibacillus phoenicis]|uniref:RelA/SpoT domain-containing protein n=1 Tax=Paenibacillus phoenicis TaxID=554117 RepID=A0ABU5PLY6_9BACL|nr:RelA/SpoT domain-containing protein [Paenibacillus phoenicis]MEA3570953.1 RelA/SpoT domain-containing protein [Paenibacillus phoenicis]